MLDEQWSSSHTRLRTSSRDRTSLRTKRRRSSTGAAEKPSGRGREHLSATARRTTPRRVGRNGLTPATIKDPHAVRTWVRGEPRSWFDRLGEPFAAGEGVRGGETRDVDGFFEDDASRRALADVRSKSRSLTSARAAIDLVSNTAEVRRRNNGFDEHPEIMVRTLHVKKKKTSVVERADVSFLWGRETPRRASKTAGGRERGARGRAKGRAEKRMYAAPRCLERARCRR